MDAFLVHVLSVAGWGREVLPPSLEEKTYFGAVSWHVISIWNILVAVGGGLKARTLYVYRHPFSEAIWFVFD